MPTDTIKVNRAPVLTLWAAVVAERMGFDREEALTLGRAVAGLSAQAKGRSLGIFHPAPPDGPQARSHPQGEGYCTALLGRQVAVVDTPSGVRALDKEKPQDPAAVARYLDQKFGAALPDVWEAMSTLAESYSPEALEQRGFDLYERFRPEVPSGARGWGVEGDLDLARLRMLVKHD